MQAWEKWLVAGGALTTVGATLIYGYTRGWFRETWTFTVDDHIGAAIFGGLMLIVGVAALIMSAITGL